VYRRADDGNSYYQRTLAEGENYVLLDGESFRPHGGTDYRSRPAGGAGATPLPFSTPHAGTVEQASGGYNTIKIRLADGSTLELLHASRIDVVVGQDVTPGTQLGLTGGKGPRGLNQFTIHLHVQAHDASGGLINPDCLNP
jgi:murein DD-endopeptidase MepM/ murein hydrolase activator NlpD